MVNVRSTQHLVIHRTDHHFGAAEELGRCVTFPDHLFPADPPRRDAVDVCHAALDLKVNVVVHQHSNGW